MSDISDELRDWAGVLEGGVYTKATAEKISSIADRIDDEMVKLPRDKDGEPIHLGDKIFDLDGDEQTVSALYLLSRKCPTWMVDVGFGARVSPSDLTHKPQDSLERIAGDIEDFAENFRTSDTNTFINLLDFSARIQEQEKGGSDD